MQKAVNSNYGIVLFNPYIRALSGPTIPGPSGPGSDGNEGVLRTPHTAFPKPPTLLEPHHQIVYCHMQDTRGGGLTLLQRSSQCILQPQVT